VVQDFSHSENPLADLATARAASPDGRVCGSFRREQTAPLPAPTLSRRLRWFLMALVLVLGQGLTAQQALAQVCKPVPKHHTTVKQPLKKQSAFVEIADGRVVTGAPLNEYPETEKFTPTGNEVYTYVEQMPQLLRGGGTTAIVAYIQQRVRWPQALSRTDIEGRVYATFIVGKTGVVREAKIVKGLAPLLDAETLRVIRTLPAFTPGRQGGHPVAVSFTVPIMFKRD
jgi:protein TonB